MNWMRNTLLFTTKSPALLLGLSLALPSGLSAAMPLQDPPRTTLRVRLGEKTIEAQIGMSSSSATRSDDEAIREAEKRAAEEARLAAEKRNREIAAAYENAARLRRLHQEAVERGDMEAARRIEREQDKASEASMKLLEFTAEEQAAMERKQRIRDRIMAEVIAEAREEAVRVADSDTAQDVKEGITNVTKHVSIGSAMQQETARSTRLANFQVAFADAKDQKLRQRLEDPKASAEEREIIQDMLALSETQKAAAEEQLFSNSMLTTAGYVADGALLATSAGVGTLLRAGAAKAAGVAGSGIGATAVRTAGKVATKDLLTKVPVESQLIKSLAANTAVGTTVDAGVQVWTTGTVDPAQLARAAALGAGTGAIGTAIVSKVSAAKAASGVGAQGVAKPVATGVTANETTVTLTGASKASAARQASGMTGGIFDRPEFRDLPSKPASEFPDLHIWRTPEEKARAATQAAFTDSMMGDTLIQSRPPRPVKSGSLWDRPGFQNIPNKRPAEIPDLDAWMTPAERAAKEAQIYDEHTVIITPDPKPAGGPTVYDTPTVRVTPEEAAKVGSQYDEHTVIITPDPKPATPPPARVKYIIPVETTSGPPAPPAPKIIIPVDTTPATRK